MTWSQVITRSASQKIVNIRSKRIEKKEKKFLLLFPNIIPLSLECLDSNFLRVQRTVYPHLSYPIDPRIKGTRLEYAITAEIVYWSNWSTAYININVGWASSTSRIGESSCVWRHNSSREPLSIAAFRLSFDYRWLGCKPNVPRSRKRKRKERGEGEKERERERVIERGKKEEKKRGVGEEKRWIVSSRSIVNCWVN